MSLEIVLLISLYTAEETFLLNFLETLKALSENECFLVIGSEQLVIDKRLSV